jgi:hypothetical protein
MSAVADEFCDHPDRVTLSGQVGLGSQSSLCTATAHPLHTADPLFKRLAASINFLRRRFGRNPRCGQGELVFPLVHYPEVDFTMARGLGPHLRRARTTAHPLDPRLASTFGASVPEAVWPEPQLNSLCQV